MELRLISGRRTLLVSKEELLKCDTCGNDDTRYLYYCTQNKRLYCFQCLKDNYTKDNPRGCKNIRDHSDIVVDEYKLI